MDAHIPHVYFRSGGDYIPPRLHKPAAHFCPSSAVRNSPFATIQNQFPRLLKSSPPRNPSLSVRMSRRQDAPSLATVDVTGTVGKGALIANPNCSTIICLRAATPLHRRAKNDMNVKVTATCIGVPFMPANAESANLQFGTSLDEDTARDILKNASGVVDIDDRATPMEASNKDDVAVGKIRSDVSQDGNFGLVIFVCWNQIRKGATLNAVQIAEMLLIMMVVRHVYRSKCSEEVPIS